MSAVSGCWLSRWLKACGLYGVHSAPERADSWLLNRWWICVVQQVRLKASELERSQCAWMRNHLGRILLEGHCDIKQVEPRDQEGLGLSRETASCLCLPLMLSSRWSCNLEFLEFRPIKVPENTMRHVELSYQLEACFSFTKEHRITMQTVYRSSTVGLHQRYLPRLCRWLIVLITVSREPSTRSLI